MSILTLEFKPEIQEKIIKLARRSERLKLWPLVEFRQKAGALLVEAGVIGPWELGKIDFEEMRKAALL